MRHTQLHCTHHAVDSLQNLYVAAAACFATAERLCMQRCAAESHIGSKSLINIESR
jgi:hypothetical protein